MQDFGLPHVGDTGHVAIIEVKETNALGTTTSVVDFSVNTVSSMVIIIKDPDGVEVVGSPFTASFNDGVDGGDGKIKATLTDIFDQPGPWTKQAKIVFNDAPQGPFHTQEIIFEVLGARV